MKATAAVLYGPNQPFTVEEISVDPPRDNEILVRIKAVGVCHTDLVLASGELGNAFPTVLGHEGAGVVEAVGKNVSKVAVGDKVLLTFNSCGHCPSCDADEPAYCQEFFPTNMGCARADGSTRLHKGDTAIADNFFGQSSFASRAICQERNVVKVKDDADLAALAPLGCGVQTGVGAVLRSLKAQAGESLVVIGGGAVGMSAVLGGVIAGCSPIILIEPQANRRDLAASLGATHTIDPVNRDTVEAVRAIVPAGADLVVDSSGFVPAVEPAVNMIANRGRLGLIGVPNALDATLPVPIMQWITIGGTVRGIVEGDSNPDEFIPQLVELYNVGRLPIDKFTTTYALADINQAIDDAHTGKCIKAVLTVD
ncbi:MAG: NAD(P)-dependent alcohol dehydrogenase [Gammaproteobacteria bacterium]|nr:NAD(P)-dependent alcohol dehydrogenase [Gammaproteobacteria bacterium]